MQSIFAVCDKNLTIYTFDSTIFCFCSSAQQEMFYSATQSSTQRGAPSPSRFVKGEFRESDYESDYEGRIPPLWKPRGGSDVEDYSFKPVKPNLANTGRIHHD